MERIHARYKANRRNKDKRKRGDPEDVKKRRGISKCGANWKTPGIRPRGAEMVSLMNKPWVSLMSAMFSALAPLPFSQVSASALWLPSKRSTRKKNLWYRPSCSGSGCVQSAVYFPRFCLLPSFYHLRCSLFGYLKKKN